MKRILIISDGKPGHLNQSIAFCKIKDVSYDILEVKFKSKFHKALSYLFDRFDFFTDFLFEDYKKYYFDFYDAVVSTGSGTYYFNKFIGQKYNKKSIALMLPKSYKFKNFYYIIAQEHDNPVRLDNILTLPLNLSYPKEKGYVKKVEDKKSLAVIIGGDNDVFNMDYELIKDELDYIFENYPDYLKYVTTSRRTSKLIENLVDKYKFDYKLIYSKEPNINPIGDFIAVCDEFFITTDSTSMLSEVRANSDAKINIIDLDSKKENTKFHRLVNIIEDMDNEKINFAKLLKKVKI
ncbi:MAG: ELM1/GtrOC1 family putative glycosyltransferase [Arcobacter sp.]|jgi:mitochondrial fission protein ELM1|uniref:ELM1/GtrOC1 family putative glycosyltransferase n=1 Tax=Arcobacter sp. TaxID=1872629 RepID=UPI002583948A|nr:ELM1/GtrOC1 family putative glycosyltransferase [Arcobacter sp.]MDD3008331.1 ELM1/GtrOC1 family putative glycosyltransferase [Arcobacter sp.]